MADALPSTNIDLVIKQQDVFTIKKKPYKVTLTDTDFTWQEENGKKKDISSVRVRDIITVKCDGNSGAGDSTSQFTVVYIIQQKNFMLRRQEVVFNGDTVKCEAMSKDVQASLDSEAERPRKLLVLINPISGSSKGREIYKTKVAPIFEEANIETDVIVTEKAHHIEEILATYDLTSVQAVALVSGDGMYNEYSNGMVRRLATDAGLDISKPDYRPPEFPLPVGLIPCGTGNGIAKGAYGSPDVVTAAYSIVLGYRSKYNLYNVFCEDELIAYYNFMLGYGVWGDMIYATENRRNQGVLRYPIACFETLIIRQHRHRLMDLSVSYKCPSEVDQMNQERLAAFYPPKDGALSNPADEGTDVDSGLTVSDKNTEEPKSSEPVSTNDSSSEWKTVRGNFTSFASTYHWDLEFSKEWSWDKRVDNVSDVTWSCMTNLGVLATFKFIYQIAKAPSDICTGPYPLLLANEWSVKLNNTSEPDSENNLKERVLSIDGELYFIKKPEFDCRMFEERIPTFCNKPKVTGRPFKK